MSIRNFSREEVFKYMNLLTTMSGNEEARLRQYSMTAFPSVQGVWTPFVNKDPKLNTAKFPNNDLSQPINLAPSATELLLELYKKQKDEEKKLQAENQEQKQIENKSSNKKVAAAHS